MLLFSLIFMNGKGQFH